MKATGAELARIAKELAEIPLHGNLDGTGANIAPLIAHFPKWSVSAADGAWCAAFAYHCCRLAGYEIPYSPDECVSCSLAGCGGWDEFAQGDSRIGYYRGSEDFSPEPGDIVLFDRLLGSREHDHIGIVLGAADGQIVTAEGNVENRSRIMTRSRNDRIRAFVRFPDGYRYRERNEPAE